MRRHRQAKHLAPKTCGHDKTTSTMAGLERVLCETCGRVSVRYLHPVIQDDTEVADRRPPAESG